MSKMSSIRLKETGDVEANVLSRQWMEYANIYLKNLSPMFHQTVLAELNNALSSQSYFGGNKITEADRTVFGLLRNIMVHFTYQEKEKYVNLSRWFSTMQIEVENSVKIQFSRTLLY